MFKKLTLLILMVFNLNFYTQVVIKDEIVLQGNDSPDAEFFIMPYYGRISGEVYTGAIINGFFQGVRVEAGDQFRLIECPCGVPCQYLYWGWAINDITEGTVITIRVYEHCVNGQPVETQLTRYSYNEVTERYLIEYFDTEYQNWYSAAWFKFISTNPPGNCPNAGGNYCDDVGWVQVPEVDSTFYSNSMVISKECSKHPNTIAAFGPAFDHRSNLNLVEMSPSNVIACYNQISETWQFNLDQNVKAYYQIGICSTHVSEKNLTFINDTTDIYEIPSENCWIALESFKAHKEYKYDIGLDIPNGGYLITPVILLHEEGHRDKWQKYMDDYFFIWESGILNFRADCEEYANIFEARMGGLNMYTRIFKDYWESAFNNYQKYTGLDPYNKEINYAEEQRVNNRDEVQKLIETYIRILEEHCGIH